MGRIGAVLTALGLLVGAACDGVYWIGPDGGVDAAPDLYGGYCHWDCFGYHECHDGEVTTWAHTPIPCKPGPHNTIGVDLSCPPDGGT